MYGLSASKGPWPVAAYASSVPSEKTSDRGPTSRGACNCSGDMKGGVPMTRPVIVSVCWSTAREMPKSMTRGPSGESTTFEGFRSRWTTPARWMSRSASASPMASLRSSAPLSGPFVAMRRASVCPWM